MKKLFFSLLLLPLGLSAQKFDISARAGVCNLIGESDSYFGFSNEVSIGYHPLKHFAISAIYERNLLGGLTTSIINRSFGISPDYTLRHFYFGADLKLATIRRDEGFGATFHPSYSYGVHAGARQRLGKHLRLNEQISLQALHMKISQENFLLFYSTGITPATEETLSYQHTYTYYYLQAGLSYCF